MNCYKTFCQNNKYLDKDISMTQPSLKQLQKEETFTNLNQD
jgi:hypothetical protein